MIIGLKGAFENVICDNSEQKKSISYLDEFRKEINLSEDRYSDLVTSYLYDELFEESNKSTFDNKLPILVCVVKNEVVRIRKFFEHYRNIGITQFAIIDNDSKDGTFQFCINQDDVNVFSVKTPYSSARRVGWINQILSKYGRNRWYLVADADELIDYVGSESFPITELINKMEVSQIRRVLGLQVDFYSKIEAFEMVDDSISWEECVYFDINSYIVQNSEKCVWYVGGPRKRIFDTYSLLTKYPLFYFDDMSAYISSHYLYPFDNNFNTECFLCIKHYEFLNQKDYQKMLEIIEKKNYASGSREYSEMFAVIEKKNKIFLYDAENSTKYISSRDLLKIEFIKDWTIS